jgi:hypothetical protein
MKKLLLGLSITAFMFTMSCKKDNSNPGSSSSTYGTFSFKGTSYTVNSCTAASQYLTATSGNVNTGPNLEVSFYGTSLPTSGGTYTVVHGGFPNSATQVGLTLNPTLTTVYAPTGGNGSNQTVTVTVTGGKVSVSGNNIELVGMTQSDSSALNFNITQQ